MKPAVTQHALMHRTTPRNAILAHHDEDTRMHGSPRHPLVIAVLAAAVVLSLAACRDNGPAAPPAAAEGSARPDREWTDAARVEAIASALQACSYDGRPQRLDPATLDGPAPGDCRAMVDQVMGYTGLPANFVVTAGPVSNAAAVILLDAQKVPQRVIAFNPDFIDATRRLTGGGQWGPVSIMAHEIGHHLSGHTITAGGSRPGLELEADKFSGFVLYKMGAPLAEATRAIDTLGSETEQATHPAKSRRIAAITQGWQEACRQAGGNCATGTATATPAATPGTQTPPPVRVATLPAPSRDAIPFKYGQFVVDETGKLDAGKLRELDQKLLSLAKEKGVELAVLVVNDLRGMTADDYAWAMMRQLRVGKLDLGNGGVVVIAPNQGTSGTAFAPGVAKKLEFFDARKQFDIWLSGDGWQRDCVAAGEPEDCARFTGYLLDVVGSKLRYLDTAWRIRFNSIEEAIAFSQARLAERRAGRKYDEKIDSTAGALIRFTGTVTDTAPKPEPLRVSNFVKDGKWRAVLVKTPEGQETTLYLQPRTAGLMPAGELKEGRQYTFVGELNSTGQFHTDQGVKQINPKVWLFSYEAL